MGIIVLEFGIRERKDVEIEAVYAREGGGGGKFGREACGCGRSEATGTQRHRTGRLLMCVLGEGVIIREDICTQTHHLQRHGVGGGGEEGGGGDEVSAGPSQCHLAARPGGV